MLHTIPYEPIDYLLIGHIAVDLLPHGMRLGGTAAYSALMARSLGLRVGIVTSYGMELPLDPLDGIPVANFATPRSTTFENILTPNGRVQYLRAAAPKLGYQHVPEAWRSASIVHLGPIAQEVEPSLVSSFPSALLGVTPQGWMRGWNEDGHVYASEWSDASFVLQHSGAAVVSVEDVQGNEERIDEMAAECRILAVTEGDMGARLFWNGDVRRFRAPQVEQVDPNGAGDIFAAAFFMRLYTTRDPWEATRFAVQVSSISVTRAGLEGVPTPEEVNACKVEVF